MFSRFLSLFSFFAFVRHAANVVGVIREVVAWTAEVGGRKLKEVVRERRVASRRRRRRRGDLIVGGAGAGG